MSRLHSFRSHASSRKRLLGATFLAALLFSPVSGLPQDATRKVLKKVPMPYPAILRSKGIGGVVRLKVLVKSDGTVRDTEVLGGNPILAEGAQKSVMQWKFSPSSSETALEVSVRFDPRGDSSN